MPNWEIVNLSTNYGLYTIEYIVWIIAICWVLAIIRVVKDISARTSNFGFQILSIIIIVLFTPIIWLPLYLAIRPINYKYDKFPRRESLAIQSTWCQNCELLNPVNYNNCVNCGTNLKNKCKECKFKFSKNYDYCPECGAPNID